MTTSKEAIAAAREIHPEYSREWLGELDDSNVYADAYQTLFDEAETKRNQIASIIQKHYAAKDAQHKIAIQNCSMFREKLASALEERDQLTEWVAELEKALRCLYSETADYITVNKLGDVHHNRSMQLARDALAESAMEKQK